MPITHGYVTLTEFKDWIGDETSLSDDILEDRVEAASRWIDSKCGRHFWQVTEARLFDTCSAYLLAVSDLVSVTTLKTDENSDGTFETTWSASDFQLRPVDAPTSWPEAKPYTEVGAIGARIFPLPMVATTARLGRIQITGVWGWPAVPQGVKTACLIQARYTLARRYSPGGIAGGGDFLMRIPSRDDPDALSALREYMPALIR